MKQNQSEPATVELVCRQYCSYFKPGQKEDLACHGFQLLDRFFGAHPENLDQLSALHDCEFKDKHHHLLHHLMCRSCDFFIEGCDFTDPAYNGEARPCGGYIAIDLLLSRSGLDHGSLLKTIVSKSTYAVLHSHCALKHLENPYLYDISTDELYELDQKGFEFLEACNKGQPLCDLPLDKDFLETCLKEGLLIAGSELVRDHPQLRQSPIPSLRYLELQITNRCNLKCKHCYLGEPVKTDLPLASVLSVLEEFEQMQGLRVLFSGGEPMLHPELKALNEALPRYKVRKVLLTNGTLIRKNNYSSWCHFDEIQFSLDGLKEGHEKIRGEGAFEQVVTGIEAAREKGMPISVATMVHRFNLGEFEAMGKWLNELDIVEWNIDVPCVAGRLAKNDQLKVTPEEGAPFLEYATGESYHGADEPFACGYHLCTVTANADVLKCSFYEGQPLGSLKEGLEASWSRAGHVPLSELECASCEHLLACKGGCRFRAESPLGKDPVMCALYGTT